MSTVIWRGKSPFNGRRILAAVSHGSSNGKTGDVDTLWILDQHQRPTRATETGADASVCGGCPHRRHHGKLGDCYVNLFHAPRGVWSNAQGQRVTPPTSTKLRPKSATIRLGGYGDPAMVPEQITKDLIKRYRNHIGYTHQWCAPWAQWARRYMMASVDSLKDHEKAISLGWRTFRVDYQDHTSAGEIICPSVTHGVQCIDCKLCSGAGKAKSIAIMAHGTWSKKHMEV